MVRILKSVPGDKFQKFVAASRNMTQGGHFERDNSYQSHITTNLKFFYTFGNQNKDILKKIQIKLNWYSV